MKASGSKIFRSLSIKLAIICVVLGAVPVLVYIPLEEADNQKNQLVLRSVQQEGRIVANSLFPDLEQFSPEVAENLQFRLAELTPEDSMVAVFFRPVDTSNGDAFLFVARHPRINPARINAELKELRSTGLLNDVSEACDRRRPLSLRQDRPDGSRQILTYFGTRRSASGCWVVISSTDRAAILGTTEDSEYWRREEIQIAAAIYAAMACLILSVFLSLRSNLRRFDGAIADILRGRDTAVSFQDRNLIPELSKVAGRFDRLVSALRRSESQIRQAAEENAHALKAPLAVISQSIEPFRNYVVDQDGPAARSLSRIEQSILKLDGLISAARQMDETTPAAIDEPMVALDVDRILSDVLEQYRPVASARDIRIDAVIPTGIHVMANEDLLTTSLENVISNALDFSPTGGVILVACKETQPGYQTIAITDQGPGVDPDVLSHLFDRYYSTRSGMPNGTNFGIGLWIVRRNVTAMNGFVHADNAPDGGLRIEIKLPLAH